MKWYTYVICIVLIIIGVFSGIQLYKEVKAESYVNGSIDISNQFSQETFNYSSSSLVFYNDIYDKTETYIFDKKLLKVNDFNGIDNEYQLYLNDYILIGSEFNAGSIYSIVEMDFYDTNGQIICNAKLNISIKFLSGETQLTVSSKGKENASFFEQYFTDNGFRLKLVEIL